ncbi:hypothetical protein Tco_0762314 [Tanacetum coccineum]
MLRAWLSLCRKPRREESKQGRSSLFSEAMVERYSLVKTSGINGFGSLQSSEDFTVGSIRKLIDEFTLSEVYSSTRWIKAVPIKVNILAWKIKLDNLPTRLNISRVDMILTLFYA